MHQGVLVTENQCNTEHNMPILLLCLDENREKYIHSKRIDKMSITKNFIWAGKKETNQILHKKNQKDKYGIILVTVLLILMVLLLFIRNNVCCIALVDGDSMYPTLKNQELYLVDRYNYTPSNGDIVMIRADPNLVGTQHIVKRIIAVGGETVRIDYEDNKIYVEGVPLDEPYVNAEYADPMFVKGDLADEPFCVPSGYVFVMGDNRNDSLDSRSVLIGPVRVSNVIGRLTMRIH